MVLSEKGKTNLARAIFVVIVLILLFYTVRAIVDFNRLSGPSFSPGESCNSIRERVNYLEDSLKECSKDVQSLIDSGMENTTEINSKRNECGNLDRNLIEVQTALNDC